MAHFSRTLTHWFPHVLFQGVGVVNGVGLLRQFASGGFPVIRIGLFFGGSIWFLGVVTGFWCLSLLNGVLVLD